MKTPKLYVFPSSVGRMTFIGNTGPRGVYVLRIRLAKSETVLFRQNGMKGGVAIALKPGEYVYVGSARAFRGAASLPGRLLRHASGINRRHPHAIRELMLDAFAASGLGYFDSEPSFKTGKWNVDYLLDAPSAELVEVFAIRSELDWRTWKEWSSKSEQDALQRRGTEHRVSDMLVKQPGVDVFCKGLGAADHSGGTHLFGIDADPQWWSDVVPNCLAHALLLEQVRYVYQRSVDALSWPTPMSARQAVILGNMHPVRGREILRRMASGVSFSKAEVQTKQDGVFDTVNWAEVVNRLNMGAGRMRIVAAMLVREHQAPHISDDFHRELATSTTALKTAARTLTRTITKCATAVQIPSLPAPPTVADTVPLGAGSVKRSTVLRDMRKSLTDLKKNARDIPRMADHNLADTLLPTASQVKTALTRLQAMTRALHQIESSLASRNKP